jgi:hypothetical protein
MNHRRHAMQALVPASASAPSAGRERLRATKKRVCVARPAAGYRKKLRQAVGVAMGSV